MVFVNQEPVWGAFSWILLVFAVNSLSLYSRGSSVSVTEETYNRLKKPKLSPPPWVFAIVWPVLYCLLGMSAYFVWSIGGWVENYFALILFIIDNCFLVIWSLLYFNFHKRVWALWWILVIVITSIGMIVWWGFISPIAAYFQIPFVLWLLFATYLNLGTVMLNDWHKTIPVRKSDLSHIQYNMHTFPHHSQTVKSLPPKFAKP